MKEELYDQLSRRERQILDVLYRKGSATVAEVREGIQEAPSYSAVRTLLRVLEDKGHVGHRREGTRYVYEPTVARDKARRSVLAHVVRTFFDDSTEEAVAALFDLSRSQLGDGELDRLSALIDEAREEGR